MRNIKEVQILIAFQTHPPNWCIISESRVYIPSSISCIYILERQYYYGLLSQIQTIRENHNKNDVFFLVLYPYHLYKFCGTSVKQVNFKEIFLPDKFQLVGLKGESLPRLALENLSTSGLNSVDLARKKSLVASDTCLVFWERSDFSV